MATDQKMQSRLSKKFRFCVSDASWKQKSKCILEKTQEFSFVLISKLFCTVSIVLCSMGVKKNSEICFFEREILFFWPQKGLNSILSEAQVETERSEVKRGQNEV